MHAHLLGGIGLSSPRCNACFAASAVLEGFYRGAAPLPLVLAALSAPFGLPIACQKPEPPPRSSFLWFSGLCHRLHGSAIATEKPEPPCRFIRHWRRSISVPLAALSFGSRQRAFTLWNPVAQMHPHLLMTGRALPDNTARQPAPRSLSFCRGSTPFLWFWRLCLRPSAC